MRGPTTRPTFVADALARFGWQRADGDHGRGGYVLAHGAASLEPHGDLAGWELFALRGPGLSPCSRERWLHDNSRLEGPVKWVVVGEGPPICRADIPNEWPTGGKGGLEDAAPGAGASPWAAWASAVTAVALGKSEGPAAAPLPVEALAHQLQRAGWAVSVDDGQLHVHLQMPDLYCQIALEPCGATAVRVRATVAELGGVAPPSRQAIVAFAHAANARLPLVRFAASGEKPSKELHAEVCLSVDCALVPGAWLAAAVEAVEAAAALTAREVQAMRDPELAKLVLAATRPMTPRKEE